VHLKLFGETGFPGGGVQKAAVVMGAYDSKCAKFCGFGHDKMKGKLIVDP